MTTTEKGAPHPTNEDPFDVVEWLDQLTAWVTARPGVSTFTTTQRDLLVGPDVWAGRIIFNSTTGTAQVNKTGTPGGANWSELLTGISLSTSTPSAEGFGAAGGAGTSTSASRADHVHPMPAHDDAAHTGVHLNALAAPTADTSMAGKKLTNVAAPLSAGDAANKGYVDSRMAESVDDSRLPARLAAGITSADGGVTDLNNVLKSGWYWVNPTTVNAPGVWGFVEVTATESAEVLQLVSQVGDNSLVGNRWLRWRKGADGTWTPWHALHDASAITVGTLNTAHLPDQLGGVTPSDTYSTPGAAALVPGADWNNANQSGWWMASGATNAPDAGWWMGEVYSHNGTYLIQRVYSFDTVTTSANLMRIYRRSHDGGAWSPWEPVLETQAQLDARYAQKQNATLAGTTTIGTADTDVEKVRAIELDVDARTVTLGRTGSKVTTITEKAGATTVKTTTLSYTGSQLNTVVEVAGGNTVTTTFNYTAGVFTGTSRSVA